MLHEEFAPASRPRTESLFPLALYLPLSSLYNRPQSVSQSLSPASPASPFIPAFFRPRSLALVYPAPLPTPRSLFLPLSLVLTHRPPSLSAISIPPAHPLIPRPRTHTRTSFLFYAALYRCSCLPTHSPSQFFHHSLRP